MDGAGNTFAPVELRADIDTSSPTSELQVTVSGNRATVNVTAVDPLSGLDVMLLSVDGKTPYPLLGSPGQVTVDLAAGAHIITLMVTDVAGNEVTRSVEVIIPPTSELPWAIILGIAAIALVGVGAIVLVRRRS